MKAMTHTSTEQPELLPCPFCGGNAHFEIDMDSRWEWVECESCGMQGNSSASLMEDCKPKLREAWNRRAPASQARVPLSDELPQGFLSDVLTAAGLVSHGKQCKALGSRLGEAVEAIWKISIQQREVVSIHGITQEKQG